MDKALIRKRCEMLVVSLVGENASDWWWNSKNKAFDMLSPNEQFEIDLMEVYDYLLDNVAAAGYY